MLTGHASHQVGLDADIWLTPAPNRQLSRNEREEMSATMMVREDRLDIDPKVFTPGHLVVIRAAAQEPTVQRIFVNAAIKKALCREAKGDRSWLHKIRPMYGHDYHFHIRIKCPPGSGECETQPDPDMSEGCSAGDFAFWFKDSTLHPKPPKEPPKPKPPMTMAQLPPACRRRAEPARRQAVILSFSRLFRPRADGYSAVRSRHPARLYVGQGIAGTALPLVAARKSPTPDLRARWRVRTSHGAPVMNRLAGIFAALLVLAGAAVPAAAQDKSITVFAAASMKNALDDIDAAYTAKTGVKVIVSYGPSSGLAKQIEQGAPADVFISADTDWMDYAISKKNINEPSRVNLLGNTIVLIAPKDSKIDNVTIGQGFDLAKLAGDGRIATGDVKSVPVGKYAKAALEKLGSWQAAEPKFAMADNVRAALTLVARNEAVLGIVYSTDAKVEPGVKIVGTFPADSHPAIIYPVAATTTAKPETSDYLAFLRSSAAKTILEKYGFKFLASPTT